MTNEVTKQAPLTGYLHKDAHRGLQLVLPWTTGRIFFTDGIREAGPWIRAHGGRLGRITRHGGHRSREAIFTKTNRLPKWARP